MRTSILVRVAVASCLLVAACTDAANPGPGSASPVASATESASEVPITSAVVSATPPEPAVSHDPSVPLPPKQVVATLEESRPLVA